MAEIIKLDIDLGLKSYQIGEAVVTFNPTDPNFSARLFDVFDKLDKKQAEREKIAASGEEPEVTFDEFKKLDEEMREMIDDVLGAGTCDGIFGVMNVYALDKEGIPVWTKVLLEIINIIGEGFEKGTQGDISKKLEKYVGRYMKKTK